MSKHRKHPPTTTDELSEAAPAVAEPMACDNGPEAEASLADAPTTADSESRLAELATLRETLVQAEERYLRLRAEFDNYRRRIQQDMLRQREHAVDRVVLALLPALDDLERVRQTVSGPLDTDSLQRGLDLVLQKFAGQLEQVEVAAFASKGQPFDSARHEALTVAEDPAQEDGLVLEEHVRGYCRGETVIRHAKVIVNKR